MRKFALAAIDMDGTLLNAKSQISPVTYEILREVDKRGCKVVLCTGRIHHAVQPYARQLGFDNYAIVGNGAQICRALSGEVIEQHLLPLEIMIKISQIGRQFGGHPRVYGTDGRVYVDKVIDIDVEYSKWTNTEVIPVGDFEKYFTEPQVKVINAMPDTASVEKVIDTGKKEFGDRVYMTPGMLNFAECMNSKASKGLAVKRLAEICSVPLEQVIVAGDHHNDLTMFDLPGVFSITCSNAQEAVRSQADMVGKSNDDDGIALMLKDLVLV